MAPGAQHEQSARLPHQGRGPGQWKYPGFAVGDGELGDCACARRFTDRPVASCDACCGCPFGGFLHAGVPFHARGALRADGQRLTSNYQGSLQVVQEGLGGIRDVLLDRSQPFFLEVFRGRNRSYRLASAAINTKGQVPRYLIEGFAVMLIVALAMTLALRGQGIEQQLPLLGTLALGAYRLLQPLQQCFSSLSTLQANKASLDRLQSLLINSSASPPRSLQQLEEVQAPVADQPLLQLQQLGFRYSPESPWVLRDLELVIQPGDRIAFVGSTGSGKSTTCDLILGLLAPTQGQLLVHGQNLYSTPGLVGAWQRRVAHVPQSIYLAMPALLPTSLLAFLQHRLIRTVCGRRPSRLRLLS